MSNPPLITHLTPATNVGELIQVFPFLIKELGDFNPHYRALQDPQMRQMMASVATLEMAAMRGGVSVAELIHFIASSVQRNTGRMLLIDSPAASAISPVRLEAFRQIMQRLHAGGSLADAQHDFAELVRQSRPDEIAEMEQHLIREGVAVSDIKKMCDVHLQVVNPSLQKVDIAVPAGHPVHTYVSENRLIESILARIREASSSGSLDALAPLFEQLAEIDTHYLRKEHQLFSYLERYGFTGPSTVMWATHDDIRAHLKAVREALSKGDHDFVAANLPPLVNAVASMIQKEESILLPTSLKLLKDEDWTAIKQAEREIGYMKSFVPLSATPAPPDVSTGPMTDGLLNMNVGVLTLEQVNLILTHLPVELSYVDENDTVRFYSNQPHKIFMRTPDAIGRKVQNCHPPKSVHLVNQILAEFRSGKRDVAEFWIPFGEMFVHIRYFAVRDEHGNYRGSLEVVQDVSKIKTLEGQRRLLEEEHA